MLEKDYRLINSFVDNNLTNEEIVVFKEKFNTNKKFAKEVKIQTDIGIALKSAINVQKNVIAKSTKKTKIIYINRNIAVGYAASLFLLIAVSIFFLSKNINIESKLLTIETSLLEKETIITKMNKENTNNGVENDSLKKQIAEYKMKIVEIENNAIEKIDNKNNLPDNKSSLKYIAQNQEFISIEEATSRGSNSEIEKFIRNKKYSKAIDLIESKIEAKDIDYCWANINIAKIALLILQENPNNVTMIDKAENCLQYVINIQDNCYEKHRHPALFLLAHIQLYKEDKNKALFYLNTLIDEKYQQKDVYKKAKELKEKLISSN